MQSQKRQNDLYSFPRQSIQYHSNPSLCPNQKCWRIWIWTVLWRPTQRRQWQPTPVLLPGKSHGQRSLLGCSPQGREEWDTTDLFTFTFHFHALEKEMATHSNVLTWRILGMGEPGGRPSVGSHRVGHDWNDLAAAAAWRPTRPSRSNTQKRCPFHYRGL